MPKSLATTLIVLVLAGMSSLFLSDDLWRLLLSLSLLIAVITVLVFYLRIL